MAKWCETCYRNELSEEWKSCDDTCPVFGKNFGELAEMVISKMENESVEDEPTNFHAYKLESEDACMKITEHLSMNGYTFDTNCERAIFIYDEESCYLETILKEHGIKYDVL